MIEVKNLVKKYGDHVAVDHLNFTVEKGQILGFLGPNGAGKSTTMNMLTGYISMTEGSVTINGFDIYEEPEEAKKAIGYLPEMPPVYPRRNSTKRCRNNPTPHVFTDTKSLLPVGKPSRPIANNGRVWYNGDQGAANAVV